MTMSYGKAFRLTLFGSSHGPEVGVEIGGLPAGTPIDVASIQADLDRRRPFGRALATRRAERDLLVIDAGVDHRGRSDGATFRAHVANEDVQSGSYEARSTVPRPGHADFPARMRYGPTADLRGGGIFSGRMTVGLVIAGSVARSILSPRGVESVAFTRAIAGIEATVSDPTDPADLLERSHPNEVGAPDATAAAAMADAIRAARRAGDSVGGVVECRTFGLPVGLGEPFFDSVESEVAHLAFSIPAVKAIEFGDGFAAARARGSAHNDPFYWDGSRVRTRTNHSGGALGGLTTGEPLDFRVAIKPTSSIARPQESVDLETHRSVRLVVRGRHDPCIVPRAVVVVEAVARVAIVELLLRGGFA